MRVRLLSAALLLRSRASLARALAVASFPLVTACAGAQIPADAETTVLSLARLDCASCGEELAKNLRGVDGIYHASFDKRRSEVTVKAARGLDLLARARAFAADEEYELVLGAGKGSYLEWAEVPAGADVVTVATDGRDVPDLAPHLAPGKVTIVDFSAAWCEPCRKLDEHVMKLVAERPDLAYRKLDVGDWDTPLAQRYLKGVPNLPYVIVYDPRGAAVETISGFDAPRLDAAIQRASR